MAPESRHLKFSTEGSPESRIVLANTYCGYFSRSRKMVKVLSDAANAATQKAADARNDTSILLEFNLILLIVFLRRGISATHPNTEKQARPKQ